MTLPGRQAMKTIHKIAGVVLVLLLIAAAYGIFRTEPPAPSLPSASAAGAGPHGSAPLPGPQVVDQTPLKIAQQLAPIRSRSRHRLHRCPPRRRATSSSIERRSKGNPEPA